MFLDCSAAIAANPPGLYSGAAAADLDGDGEVEFFVCGSAGPNRVLKWTGSALQDVTPPDLADPGGPAAGAAFADLDGDGREELYVLAGGSARVRSTVRANGAVKKLTLPAASMDWATRV